MIGHLVSQRHRLKAGLWRALAIAAGLAGVLVAPFAIGYLRLQRQPGFERPSVPAWGLKAADLFTPAPRSYLYDWMARIGTERDGEHMHFLGFVVMGLALVGLVVALRRRRGRTWRDDLSETPTEPVEDRRHRELRLLMLAGVISLVLAIGPEAYGVTDAHGGAARSRARLRRHQGVVAHGSSARGSASPSSPGSGSRR